MSSVIRLRHRSKGPSNYHRVSALRIQAYVLWVSAYCSGESVQFYSRAWCCVGLGVSIIGLGILSWEAGAGFHTTLDMPYVPWVSENGMRVVIIGPHPTTYCPPPSCVYVCTMWIGGKQCFSFCFSLWGAFKVSQNVSLDLRTPYHQQLKWRIKVR